MPPARLTRDVAGRRKEPLPRELSAMVREKRSAAMYQQCPLQHASSSLAIEVGCSPAPDPYVRLAVDLHCLCRVAPPEHSSSNSSGLYGSVCIGPSPVGGQERQEDSDLLLMGLLKWPGVLAVVPLVRNCSDVQPLLAELTGIINYWLSLCFCN